jgi:hypothetical protein
MQSTAKQKAALFPSLACADKVRELRKSVKDGVEKVEGLNRKRTFAERNRQTLELENKNPDEVIRGLTAELADAEREVSLAKSQLSATFFAENKAISEARQAIWSETYAATVRPYAERVAALAEGFEKIGNEIVSLLKSNDGASAIVEFDKQIESWNRFAVENGGPANAMIDPSQLLATTFRNSVFGTGKILARMEDALNNVRAALGKPRLVPNPKSDPVPVETGAQRAARMQSQFLHTPSGLDSERNP